MSARLRLPDWQQRLHALIESRRCTPFAWGSHDCCLFAADAVLAVSGHDPAAALRGYSGERQAQRLLQREGGLQSIVDAQLGSAIAPLAAQVGDIGLVESGGRDCLAVCGGAHWLAPGAQGLEALPMAAARLAWRSC